MSKEGMSPKVREGIESPQAEREFFEKEESSPDDLAEKRREIREKQRVSIEDGTLNKEDGGLGEDAWNFIELVRQKTGNHYTALSLAELEKIREEAKILYELIVLIEAANHLEKKEPRQ